MTDEEFRQRERDNVLAALKKADWKIHGKGGAAELLGVKPSTLISRIKKQGIKKPA
jgi:transcriptional regulator with GAF, ATPase, and Fis domain